MSSFTLNLPLAMDVLIRTVAHLNLITPSDVLRASMLDSIKKNPALSSLYDKFMGMSQVELLVEKNKLINKR